MLIPVLDHAGKAGEGIRDALNRRISTNEWVAWKEEVVWIRTYSTFGVWLSIGMMFVRF
jgi:hypothetical protein